MSRFTVALSSRTSTSMCTVTYTASALSLSPAFVFGQAAHVLCHDTPRTRTRPLHRTGRLPCCASAQRPQAAGGTWTAWATTVSGRPPEAVGSHRFAYAQL